jgi:hypothetical protein
LQELALGGEQPVDGCGLRKPQQAAAGIDAVEGSGCGSRIAATQMHAGQFQQAEPGPGRPARFGQRCERSGRGAPIRLVGQRQGLAVGGCEVRTLGVAETALAARKLLGAVQASQGAAKQRLGHGLAHRVELDLVLGQHGGLRENAVQTAVESAEETGHGDRQKRLGNVPVFAQLGSGTRRAGFAKTGLGQGQERLAGRYGVLAVMRVVGKGQVVVEEGLCGAFRAAGGGGGPGGVRKTVGGVRAPAVEVKPVAQVLLGVGQAGGGEFLVQGLGQCKGVCGGGIVAQRGVALGQEFPGGAAVLGCGRRGVGDPAQQLRSRLPLPLDQQDARLEQVHPRT